MKFNRSVSVLLVGTLVNKAFAHDAVDPSALRSAALWHVTTPANTATIIHDVVVGGDERARSGRTQEGLRFSRSDSDAPREKSPESQ